MSDLNECPKCKSSWIGDPIPEHQREFFGFATHFKRELGQTWNDHVQRWHCPDCKAVFDRWTMEEVKDDQ